MAGIFARVFVAYWVHNQRCELLLFIIFWNSRYQSCELISCSLMDSRFDEPNWLECYWSQETDLKNTSWWLKWRRTSTFRYASECNSVKILCLLIKSLKPMTGPFLIMLICNFIGCKSDEIASQFSCQAGVWLRGWGGYWCNVQRSKQWPDTGSTAACTQVIYWFIQSCFFREGI